MPRIIGLLSWYSERPDWLAGCIASYARFAGITHLIALDGAYALFPDALAASNSLEHDMIVETSRAEGLHTTLVIPDRPWEGNEVEKRNALFRLADTVSDPEHDWLVVIDADEIVTGRSNPDAIRSKLGDTEHHAASCTLWERKTLDTPSEAQVARSFSYDPNTAVPHRKLFRAFHGITVVNNHFTYVAPGLERPLWGQRRLCSELDLTTDLIVEHRTAHRAEHRRQQSSAYYKRRDLAGVES